MLPRLSLEEQVGQVIMGIAAEGLERIAGPVALGHVGGVVVPPGAAAGPLDLALALNRLQGLATYPLLCAADLEARPAPFVPGATRLPGALALGAARRPELSRRCGALLAEEARAMGLHLLLGPVLDVYSAPDVSDGDGRSFGASPTLVASLGTALVEGCQERRALATGCHFPGRGNAVYDPERDLTILPQGRQALDKIDLLPYVEASRAGLGAIMTGHLHVAALDVLPTRLATHSSTVVEGLLRRTLGFRGLLLTADLGAPEISARYDTATAAVLAFAAGHDLLLTKDPEAVYRALYEVMLHGDVPAARLQEAVRRVWLAKEWLGLLRERIVAQPSPDPAPGQALAREVARASLTAVRGQAGLFSGRRSLLLTLRGEGNGNSPRGELPRLAEQYLSGASVQVLDAQLGLYPVDELLAAAGGAEAVILFAVARPGPATGGSEALVALAREIRSAGLPLGVVLLGNPYALARFPEADLLLHAPGEQAPCLEAALTYLSGQAEAPGRLPVSVPGV